MDEGLRQLIAEFQNDMSRAQQEIKQLSRELISTLRAFLRNPKHRRFLDLAADHLRAREGGFTPQALARLGERLSLRYRLPREEVLAMTPFETRHMPLEDMTIGVYKDPPCLREVPLKEKDALLLEGGIRDRHRENIARAADLLGRMNDTERKIFLLMAKGMKAPKIAHRLGMKEPAVRVRIHRFRKKISRQV